MRVVGNTPIPMEFEVRHAGSSEQERKTVGVFFTHMRPADRRRLDEVLAEPGAAEPTESLRGLCSVDIWK